MTHVELTVAPDNPEDDDPKTDQGLTDDAAARLRIVLEEAGFRVVAGPFARPPLSGRFGGQIK